MTEQPQFRRSIRSFVKREGKMTKGQINAIELLWPKFGIDLAEGLVDFEQRFGRSSFTILEIGFGNGLSLADMAEQQPEQNFVGIEVHKPGVGSLLVQVKKRDLQNVHVSYDDAVDVLAQQVPDGSLDRIQIFFPDPWHKKRHHKRRLIQPDFVAALVNKLKPNGVIHVATDWQNYAEHILEVLAANPDLSNTAQGDSSTAEVSLLAEGSSTAEGSLLAEGSESVPEILLAQGCVPKPEYRPNTKYEERGKRLGHGVWDIVFEKK